MVAPDVITQAIEVLRLLRQEKEVTIRFMKKDESTRIMKCTLDFDQIPKEKHPKKVDLPNILEMLNKHRILRVYDLEKNDWRSIPLDRTEWLETPEKRYSIRVTK